ncbi:ABC-type transport auxiliary lipoprotein family protein [Devosia sp. A8/3-2]|nr:ABC-type transport auxiliary lipoprotein family protein [Devosia sp. A8/3-2]
MSPARRSFMAGGASILAPGLAGCFGVRAPITYDLGSVDGLNTRRRSSRVVVITLPKTVQTYDSQRIVIRDAGNVLAYLPEAQLSDTLPRSVQTRLLQTFEASNFPNIGRPDDQLRVDVTLATELRAFEIDVGKGARLPSPSTPSWSMNSAAPSSRARFSPPHAPAWSPLPWPPSPRSMVHWPT